MENTIPPPSDSIIYKLYLDEISTNSETSLPPLINFATQCRSHVLNKFPNYLWQDQGFNLEYDIENVPHLVGTTHFGDYIDDEWFVVYMLVELTKLYSNLTVSVTDESGEFLLVEAALHVPRWLKPANSMNRVWIRNGWIHIIPKPNTPDEFRILPVGKELTVEKALEIVRRQMVDTRCSESVQKCIDGRINKMLDNLEVNQNQWEKVFLPIDIAYILKKKPEWVSKAVNYFYYRDPLQMRKAYNFKRFPVNDGVMTMVRFTRCHFAMLLRQKVTRPPSAFKLPKEDDPLYKAYDLGMKLTIGFEIFYSEEDRRRRKIKNSKLGNWKNYDFINDDTWKDYILNIEKKGFFGSEMKGSQEYIRLEKIAMEYYVSQINVNEISVQQADDIDSVTESGKKEDYNREQFNTKFLFDNSPEDWLYVSPEEVDRLIEEKQKEMDSFYENNVKKGKEDVKMDKNNLFDTMVDEMNDFISRESDYKGVEFNDEQFDPKNFDFKHFSKILGKKIGVNLDEMHDDMEDESSGDKFYDIEDEEMMNVMDMMDEQLLKEKDIGESFEKVPDEGLEKNEVKPIDINLNLVKNFLESFSAQDGLSGPVSNLLKDLEMKQ